MVFVLSSVVVNVLPLSVFSVGSVVVYLLLRHQKAAKGLREKN